MPPISSELGIDMAVVTGVTQDSRAVQSGYVFAALQGGAVDGRQYIPDALQRGATIILSDQEAVIEGGASAALIKRDNPRRDFALLASEFYAKQPKNIVAVTGTNGKSSVVHFANQLWQALGECSDFIGTLSGALTTPDPVSLHEKLLDMAQVGITHCAMEASSHGLAQYRMDGANISVAAFTSFTQDHLDFHDTMQDYLAAKERLFSELLPLSGVAVLNADIPVYSELKAICKRRGVRVLSYGEKGEDLKLMFREIDGVMQDISVEIFGSPHAMRVPFVGAFQVMNVLCALGCVIAQEPNDDARVRKLVTAVSALSAVPGRLEHVESPNGKYHAYVDYAHTPDALENVLTALRAHTKGRLMCVFGCGGDRDQTKRAMMGEISARLSDIVIITDDNPRSENPSEIRKQIVAGINNPQSMIVDIEGRKAAIDKAVGDMMPDDIVLIAGKGHEKGQIFKGKTEPFDDVLEVKRALTAYKL